MQASLMATILLFASPQRYVQAQQIATANATVSYPLVQKRLASNLQSQIDSVEPLKYIALGDSYTICEGVAEDDRWPNLMCKHLRDSGVDIELIANPSVTGYTTAQLIETELPVFDTSAANFATLLIGVNDWVQGVSPDQYRQNLQHILDVLMARLPANRLVMINIPDFSITPSGPKYSRGRDIRAGIAEFNAIMEKEAAKRGLAVVDVFSISLSMAEDPARIGPDDLHPAAPEYVRWEAAILPVVLRQLQP